MTVWGVLHPGSYGTAGRLEHQRDLTAALDGLVIVPADDHDESDRHGEPPAPRPRVRGPLAALVAGLRSVPPDAELIALVDGGVLDGLGVEAVVGLIPWLDAGHAAVARAVPVTDALKRVDGDTVLGGLERAGLHRPLAPHVIRRSALVAALAAPPATGRTTATADPVHLLVGAGHPVRLVREGGPPMTVGPGA